MKITANLAQIPKLPHPIVLTIGIFDGVHQGHQAIIKEMHKLTRKGGTRAVLTFSNHPSSILTPNQPISLIVSLAHRLQLLGRYGINLTIVPPFTCDMVEQSHQAFLHSLHTTFPFDELILGEGEGLEKYWKRLFQGPKMPLAKQKYKIRYIRRARHGKQIISSRLIRMLIKKCNLQKIKKIMGRPYSIWKEFDPILIKQENETLYTYSFEKKGLCSLPPGVYAIHFEVDQNTPLPAIALLRPEKHIANSSLFITICLTKRPPCGDFVNILFIKYLHSEVDPTSFQSKSYLFPESLSVRLSLS